jgi:hypothetical protein
MYILEIVMKRLIVLMFLASANAFAIDFDKEWAKFDTDFAKMKSRVAKTSIVPVEVKTIASDIIQVDPKSSDRLGLSLSDQSMVNPLELYYEKSDSVVGCAGFIGVFERQTKGRVCCLF